MHYLADGWAQFFQSPNIKPVAELTTTKNKHNILLTGKMNYPCISEKPT